MQLPPRPLNRGRLGPILLLICTLTWCRAEEPAGGRPPEGSNPASLADQQEVPLMVYCFRMPKSSALNFILSTNPSGQAGYSLERLEALVRAKKASLCGKALAAIPLGQRATNTTGDMVVNAEATAPPDCSIYTVCCEISIKETKLTGTCLIANQFGFLGAAVDSKDPDSVYFVYLLVLPKTGEK